jgi:uncharacterized protein YrrD
VTADPASWLLLEHGWEVVDRDGGRIGDVHEVLGDFQADIFDGLTVHTRLLGKPCYIPAERVTRIVEGRVETDLAPGEIEQLPERNNG